MPNPSTQEVHAAIAAYITDSGNSNVPLSILAERLGISVSTLRRVALEFGIVRRPRLGRSVLEKIELSRQQEEKPFCQQCGQPFIPILDGQMWCESCNRKFVSECDAIPWDDQAILQELGSIEPLD